MEDRVINFYPYKIFKINNKKYLYTVKTSGIFEIDERTEKLLKCEKETLAVVREKMREIYSNEELLQILLNMKQEGFLYFDDILQYETAEVNVSALTLMIAQVCNMRCTYCYGEGGEYHNKGKMSEKVAKKAIDYLVSVAYDDKLHIAFLGGEPLLNFSLIKFVVTYCKEIEVLKGKKFSYTITTNGTLLTPEIEKYLIENQIVCQISIDGIKEKHNNNRFFANKKGSYDIVVNKTEDLREKNLVTARATVTPDNSDYEQIFNHLDELGFKAIPIAIAQNMVADSEFQDIMKKYKEYIGYFQKLIKEKKYEKARRMTDLMVALEKLEYGSEHKTGCGAGRTMYAVDIDGSLYPCHRFVGNSKFVLGNIFDGADSDSFLETIHVKERKKCSECWARNLCLGCCPHENYTNTGNVNEASKRSCKIARMLYEELMKVYIDLLEDDKKIFEY